MIHPAKTITYLFVIFFLSLQIQAIEKAPSEIIKLANDKLIQYGSDPILINAVKSANSKVTTIDEIQKVERLWQGKNFNDPSLKQLLNSSLAHYLKGFRKKDPHIEEVYLLDKKGVLIATAKYEEMYWWKDDLGFKSAITGKLYIADVELDEDENRNMVHVVLPIKDKELTIGALNIGLILR